MKRPITQIDSAALSPAVIPINGQETAMPSSSIRMTEPNRKAASPPKPSAPKLGAKASPTISRMPSRIRATPA
jgi:hypothetical protein